MSSDEATVAVLASRLLAVEQNLTKVLDKLDDKYVRADQLTAAANSWAALLDGCEARIAKVETWQSWVVKGVVGAAGSGVVALVIHWVATAPTIR